MSRQFGETVPTLSENVSSIKRDVAATMEWLKQDEFGRLSSIDTPFGKRNIIYCDYTASARSLKSIENFIADEVLPYYGNTHSSVTATAEQTTLYVHEAKQEVRAMCGAGDGDDVIFTGNGSTAAVDLLVHLINHTDLVVIHSIQEHHSNLLPWRKHAHHCYCVKNDSFGRIDQDDLVSKIESAKLKFPSCRILAAFTACSNLTGILNNVVKITNIVKSYGCISVWDYASAAPYVELNVNGSAPIDAVFFSGHKFPGGVGSPGVLVVKKAIINTKEPKRIGGGTVFFVNAKNEWFLKDAEYREEGGTPDAVGTIRLALAIKLKRSIGESAISNKERELSCRFLSGIQNCSKIHLLGPAVTTNRISIFSFLVLNKESGMFYHHNYISVLLNDLFGIQTRSGCMCAGPYALHLLNIDEELSDKYINALREDENLDRTHLRRFREYSQQEMLRPGFTRISIPYFFNEDEVDHIVKCLLFVAEHASDFIHLYQLTCESAEWHHIKQRVFHGRRWLGHVNFTERGIDYERKKQSPITHSPEGDLTTAMCLAKEALLSQVKASVPDGRLAVDKSCIHLRWFVLPIEIVNSRKSLIVDYPELPFVPLSYSLPVADNDGEDEANHLSVVSRETSPSNNSSEETVANHDREDELLDNVDDCEPCSASNVTVCPLDPADVGKGRMGDFSSDDAPEIVKETDDWSRRVIVSKQLMTLEQEMQLPWEAPPLDLYKRVTEAIHGLDMIQENDKILVCLSGGKDSLALLHILHFYQMRCKKNRSTNFQLGAITVDPGSSAYNPRPLIEYCRSLNIDYFYEEQDIIGAAKKLDNLRSICAFCSRMKRGRLAAASQLHGWNVLAMGQHLDDLAESFFIAAFQNGNLSTMKAHYTTRDSQLRVIRPLVFVREKSLREFSELRKLPIIAENCPACFNQATERHRIKQLLAQQELVFPELFHSLRSALRPLLLVDSASTDEMRAKAIENIIKNNKGKAK